MCIAASSPHLDTWRVLGELAEGELSVFTDPVASPTGFPFKVLELKGTLSDKDRYM